MTKRVNVLGVGLSVLNPRTALGVIADAVRARRKGYICVTGVHGVMEKNLDHALPRGFCAMECSRECTGQTCF